MQTCVPLPFVRPNEHQGIDQALIVELDSFTKPTAASAVEHNRNIRPARTFIDHQPVRQIESGPYRECNGAYSARQHAEKKTEEDCARTVFHTKPLKYADLS